MEYANNGDLYQKIVNLQKKGRYMPESEVWNIFYQVYYFIMLYFRLIFFFEQKVVNGLKALHDLKILHRDMKVKILI